MTRRRTIAALAAGAVLVAATATTGIAASEQGRGPRPAEARSITAGVKGSPVAGLRQVRARFDVRAIRVSTLSPYWATASVVPKPAFADTFQAGYAVLIRLALPARPGPWAVVDAGSSEVACGIAPNRVLVDLGRGGCPPGERL